MAYDLGKLWPVCRALTFLYLATEAAFITVTIWEVGYYEDVFSEGAYLDPEWSALDAAISIAAFGLLAATVAAYVANGIWLYRAGANAGDFDPDPGRISPGWCVGWHVVPFANFWMPFRAMKQIWNSSTGAPIDAPVRHPFGLWWALWVVSSIIASLSHQLYRRAEELEDWIAVGYLDISASTIGVAAAIFYLRIMRDVTRAQSSRANVDEVFA